MAKRIDYAKVAPEAVRALSALERYVDGCGLEVSLLDLIKLRASQINGCAYCVDMHYLDARARGETEQRLSTLVVWSETPFFTERERAALLWTEKVTLISADRIPDAVFEETRTQFSEEELVKMTLAISTINAWNRFCISFRSEPGHYTPNAERTPAR